MADKKVRIGIETTANTSGAEKTVDALDDVVDKGKELETALDKVDSGGLPAIPAQAKKAATEVKEVVKESAKLGKGQGNSATAVLEFSRAFEDAQYGIRGVLNNIPGLIAALGGGAGLAGVISIAAVAGSVLWEKFGSGAKTAKGETEDLSETFSKLLKVYKDFEDLGKDTREKAAADVAGNLKKELSGIDNTFQISIGAEDIATAKANAEAQIKLAQDKLNLTRIEAKLITATGEDAVKLAKQREGIIKQIYSDEQAIAEIGRTAAINKAQAKADATGGKLDTSKAASESLTGQYQALDATVKGLRAEADTLAATRNFTSEQLNKERDLILERIKRVESSFAGKTGTLGLTQTRDLLKDRNDAEALKNRINDPKAFDKETNLEIQAQAKEPALKELKATLDAAAAAENEAAKALTQATLDLKNLRQTQGIQREGEAGLKRITDAGAADQKLAGGKADVVGQLDTLVSGIGESGGKDLAPFITEMKSILQDKALSADELARLPTLLAQYFAKIANLGQGQNKAIRDAMSKVDELEREVRGLKTAASGRNP